MARPAPAAPIIGPAPPLARVIGPAPPAGFVRAAKCPALDRDRVDVQVDAVALADENALGALLQRATRTVGLLLWATVSEADNVAQGPFRLPVLRFEEVRTGRTVALVVRGSGELPTRKDALHVARRRPPLLRPKWTRCSPRTRRRRIEKTRRARGAPRSRLGSSSNCRASGLGGRRASRMTGCLGPRGRRGPREPGAALLHRRQEAARRARRAALARPGRRRRGPGPASGAPPPPPETLQGSGRPPTVPPGKLPPRPARDATGGRVLDVAIAICGDANAGRRRDRGGREMTREEVDQLKGRVVGRTVTWGNCEGVVEDVTLVGADALSLSGFSGLDVKVATYFRLRGDGDRWGVRAAAKALGEGVISELAALATTPTPPRSRRSGRARPRARSRRSSSSGGRSTTSRSRASSCGRRGSRRCRTTCPSSSRRSSAPRSRRHACVCTVPPGNSGQLIRRRK